MNHIIYEQWFRDRGWDQEETFCYCNYCGDLIETYFSNIYNDDGDRICKDCLKERGCELESIEYFV